MEFRILGPLEVIERGQQLKLGGSRQRALLALLLTRANEVVSTDRLIDELWAGSPPEGAANALQYHVSRVRKTLAREGAIVTQPPGYVIRLEADELDLLRFERLVDEARQAPPARAAPLLRDALALWRGAALADLADEPFAQDEARRLEELRLAALEHRIDADLTLGGGAGLVGELEALVREHPLREPFRAQLMLALYRSGRQAEALDVYREARRLLVEELGVEPGAALHELEKAILRQDPGLDPGPAPPDAPQTRSVLVVAGDADLDDLLAIAEPAARDPSRELILVRLLGDQDAVAAATRALAETRRALAERGATCRVAAFTTTDPGLEAVQLANRHGSELLLVAASPEAVASGRFDEQLTVILEQAPCDVGVLATAPRAADGPVVTPFGGVEHDWSAIELAARLAGSLGTTLRLLGTEADDTRGRRDASRLLARASMLVQEVIGIVTEPVLVPAGEDGVLAATRDARLLVIGLSDRWRTEGLGSARLAVAAGARVPTLFVRRGAQSGGVVPAETYTRFTWTLAPESARSASA